MNGITSFTFFVSHVNHGVFQVGDGHGHWTNATSFSSTDLANGLVRFVTDGSYFAPTFSVRVDDGGPTPSDDVDGVVQFTNSPPPQITAATFTVVEGGSTVLSTANFVVSDQDTSSTGFTFTVSHVTHGSFQIEDSPGHWINTSSFTTADLLAGHVRFLDDGTIGAPTFTVPVVRVTSGRRQPDVRRNLTDQIRRREQLLR
jgi:hypothetical protein